MPGFGLSTLGSLVPKLSPPLDDSFGSGPNHGVLATAPDLPITSSGNTNARHLSSRATDAAISSAASHVPQLSSRATEVTGGSAPPAQTQIISTAPAFEAAAGGRAAQLGQPPSDKPLGGNSKVVETAPGFVLDSSC